MTERALTLRLDEELYQELRLEAFKREHPISRVIREAIAARPKDRPLTIRPNPPMPSDEDLLRIESEAVIGHWGGDAIALANAAASDVANVGRRALWRHGCDTGMVPPQSQGSSQGVE